ncbi:HTH_Tnp_Tc3_2 domain-containing protein [Trichonephila clavipes]|nr:HTH_Tnp_Tc3_2 domain-containing protein [Trichonephila clavipes]
MIVRSSGQGVVLPQKVRVLGGRVALLRLKTAVFGKLVTLRTEQSGAVACILLIPSIAICGAIGVKLELIGGWNGDRLCFMKVGPTLVPVLPLCWSEGCQGNACNQAINSLDTLDIHLESWHGESFPMTAGALS